MANEIITYSDGYEWLVIPTQVAIYMLDRGGLEVCELYVDDEAEGLVESISDLKERLAYNPNAIFAVGVEDIENHNEYALKRYEQEQASNDR